MIKYYYERELFPGEGMGTIQMSESQVLDEYFVYWVFMMRRRHGDNWMTTIKPYKTMIETCIDDWCVLNWGWKKQYDCTQDITKP